MPMKQALQTREELIHWAKLLLKEKCGKDL